MKCIIDVSDWLSAVGAESHARIRPPKRYSNETATQTHTNAAELHTHTTTHTLDCWRAPPIRKPLGVNLVAGDVICAWTRRCHSNGGGRWLRACRFIRMLSCCNGACRSINETTLRTCCFFSSTGVFCIIWSYSYIPPSTSENTGRCLYIIITERFSTACTVCLWDSRGRLISQLKAASLFFNSPSLDFENKALKLVKHSFPYVKNSLAPIWLACSNLWLNRGHMN